MSTIANPESAREKIRTDLPRLPELLPSAADLKRDLPLTVGFGDAIQRHRQNIEAILRGDDDRLLVIVGPCSIHDTQAAIDYARRLKALSEQVSDTMLLVMRCYFEKPRTTVGWKGMMHDPELNGGSNIASGLRQARSLLLELATFDLPVATEALSPLAANYIDDLLSWVAIGARTTESQTHREMASALSMAVGFKNGTDGSIDIAIHAMQSASHPHSFLGCDDLGRISVIHSTGNSNPHLVLRGGKANGKSLTNYDLASIRNAALALGDAGFNPAIIVDCSHENSGKNHERQPEVFREVVTYHSEGEKSVKGVMLESFLESGREDIGCNAPTYGKSVTDACIDWGSTRQLILQVHDLLKSARIDSLAGTSPTPGFAMQPD